MTIKIRHSFFSFLLGYERIHNSKCKQETIGTSESGLFPEKMKKMPIFRHFLFVLHRDNIFFKEIFDLKPTNFMISCSGICCLINRKINVFRKCWLEIPLRKLALFTSRRIIF